MVEILRVLCFVFTFFAIGNSVAYNETFCRYMTWPMASATFGTTPDICVKQNFANSSFIRQITVPCDQIKQDTCSGFTAVSYSDKAIIIALRGSLGDIQVADEVIYEIFKNKTKFVGGGLVNVYFYQAFLDIWQAGMRDDFLTVKNANPDFELWVTGHSLGAAMASLCAGYIAAMGYIPGDKIKLVTYGQPRTGDGAYADFIDNTIPYVYRIIHAHDLVPHLPPIWIEMLDWSNYTHHKNEIWYNNNMAVGQPHLECDVNESDQCSNQLEKNIFDLNPNDHDYYFNVSTGFAESGCPGYNPGKFVVVRK